MTICQVWHDSLQATWPAAISPACIPGLLTPLRVLFAAHPGLRDRVLTESTEIRQHVNIFVGNENVRYLGGLATPVSPSAEISIVPAISGG
jgi:molybdopterin converting factor small subunit